MKIMNRVTGQYLKKNRRRTLVTILGVIISVAMITALSTFTSSFQDLMLRQAVQEDGDWQVEYLGVPLKDLPRIREQENTAALSLSQIGSAVQLPGVKYGRPAYLVGVTPEYTAMRSRALLEGRFPENGNEICVFGNINDWMDSPLRVGDRITVTLGKRAEADDPENPLNPNNPVTEEEIFIPEEERTVTVVGMMDGSGSPWSNYLYTFLDPASLDPETPVDVTVRLNRLNTDLYEEAKQVGGGIAQNGIQYNDDYLRFCGIIDDDYFLTTILLLTLIVAVIIMIGSVLLIYNAFAISVSERGRQLGLLASVGATRSQKRGSVLFEGAVVGGIAIPFGVVFGILGIGVTFHLVSPWIQNALGVTVPFQVKVSWPGLLAAVLFSGVTILVSVLAPARRAGRITPMEAIRQSGEVRLKRRQVRTSPLTRKLFGFEGELALKNLKRNRRRYRSTIISLTVSILLFLSAAGFTHFLTMAYGMSTGDSGYDIVQRVINPDDALLQELSSLEGIREISSFRFLRGEIRENEGQISAEALRIAEENWYGPAESEPEYPSPLFYVTLSAPDDASLRRYAEQAGVSYESLLDTANPGAILINEVDYKNHHDFTRLRLLDAKAGDELTLPLYRGDMETGEEPPAEVKVRLAALTDKAIPGLSNKIEGVFQLTAVVSEPVFGVLAAQAGWTPENLERDIYYSSDDPMALEQTILEKMETLPQYRHSLYNVVESRVRQQQLTNLVAVFVYGFVTLITLVSVANIFNTISTSVSLRTREFAMLRSVGMTPKGFNRMVRFESVFYGMKALLYGLPLSLAATGLMFTALSRNFDFSFSLPWAYVAGAVLGVFAIVGLTMLYSSAKVRRLNIIEALTQENL